MQHEENTGSIFSPYLDNTIDNKDNDVYYFSTKFPLFEKCYYFNNIAAGE